MKQKANSKTILDLHRFCRAEQGRSEPDLTARAYLKAIAAAPEAIQQALQS